MYQRDNFYFGVALTYKSTVHTCPYANFEPSLLKFEYLEAIVFAQHVFGDAVFEVA